jgi:hypothetical protein
MSKEQLSAEQAQAEVNYWKSYWNMRCIDTMLKLVKENQTLTADTFRAAMVEQNCPPRLIALNAPAILKSFLHQRYLRKERNYILSDNGSRVLPVYTSLKYEPKTVIASN